MFVIPAKNPLSEVSGMPPRLKVRDPDLGGHLPDEGREVPPSEYWTRRLRDGDVTLGADPATPTI